MNPELAALTGEYTIDPAHSTLGFVARHAMVTNVKGKFLDFSGACTWTAATRPRPAPPSTSRWTASTPVPPTATAT